MTFSTSRRSKLGGWTSRLNPSIYVSVSSQRCLVSNRAAEKHLDIAYLFEDEVAPLRAQQVKS
jgi:hypothetical protein